ncbi:MAG: D-alanine--D-alanine ligase family protein [Vicinamibacterales bacterium]
MKKLRVGVIYGGRSGEHEVSLASGAAIFSNLDRNRYDPVPILIERDGRWIIADRPPQSPSAAEAIRRCRQEARVARHARELHLVAHPAEENALTIERRPPGERGEPEHAYIAGLHLDVYFPVLHGPHGEDGTIQGLFELANVPYVGAGVLASAMGMDKAVMKTAFAAAGLPVTGFVWFTRARWDRDTLAVADEVSTRLGYPVFVKPANMGSSVGISKVTEPAALGEAVELASSYDRKVIVEAAVPDPQELECGVLGSEAPEASEVGEIVPGHEFYDYDAKYLDTGAETIIPARISAAESSEVKRLALAAFKTIDAHGMARVDFLLSRPERRIVVSEINTIPGFTTISMFPKLWEASGVSFSALLDRLIALALERHQAKQRLRTACA